MRLRAGLVVVPVFVSACTSEVPPSISEEARTASIEASGPQDSGSLSFEKNYGQVIGGDDVRYLARTKDATVYVTDRSLVIVVWEPLDGEGPPEGSVVRIT